MTTFPLASRDEMMRSLTEILLALQNGQPGWLSLRILERSFYVMRSNGHHAPEVAREIIHALHPELDTEDRDLGAIRAETGPASRHEIIAARGRLSDRLRAVGHDPAPLLAGLDRLGDTPAWVE